MNRPDRAPTRKEATHDRIVRTAARAIRRSGYAGTGVADLMNEAGLTHGGFYAHFASRDALLAEAVEEAGRETVERLDAHLEARVAAGASPFRALVESYLSEAHRDAPEHGCVVAALVSEMPRQSAAVRAASAERVRRLVERVRKALPGAAPAGAASLVGATLVGTLVLARALDDDAEARVLLRRARKSLLDAWDRPPA